MGSFKIFVSTIIISLSLWGCGHKTEENARGSEIPSFQRPSNATDRIEGQKFPYCLWYNPKEWMIWETPFESKGEVSEWNLVLVDSKDRQSIGKNTKIRAETSTYPYKDKNLAKKDFKALIQNRIVKKGNLEEFVDLGSEDRLVNNLKVYAWNFKFKYANSDEITAYVYFYSDSDGSVAIVSFTPTAHWEENKDAMINLLNGFCLLPVQSQDTTT